jgi:hypothetical protein
VARGAGALAAWGMVTATAYAWHLALMCLFALLALDLHQPRVAGLLAYLPVALVLVLVSFACTSPGPGRLALGLLAPLGLATWGSWCGARDASAAHRVTATLLARHRRPGRAGGPARPGGGAPGPGRAGALRRSHRTPCSSSW